MAAGRVIGGNMKYVWLGMLAILFLIWGVFAIKDILYCNKTYRHPFSYFEEYTNAFITTIVFIPFIISLCLWLKEIE